jgi:peptidoglycan hydrolase-like protein with peptidoglycan-binding domain
MTPQNIYTIQNMLIQMGYRVPLSARLDDPTVNAIIQFQMRLKITPDGELNPNTIQAIIESVNPVRMARPQVVEGAYSADSAPTHFLPKPSGV